MLQVTSSTLLSKNSHWRITWSVVMWVVLWLLIFELLFYITMPPIPATVKPNQLQRYFEYGRSVEGKMHKMIAPTDEATAKVALAGWLVPSRWRTKPNRPKTAEDLLIAIYGMSFAQHLGQALAKLEPRVTVRFIGGPSAPPNHTYTAYLLDRKQHAAQVVAMGILASSVVGMTTITGMNKAYEHPAPFTFRKYRRVENHQLEPIWPKVRDLADLRRFLNDKMLWGNYIQQLQAQDSFYHPFLFHQNFTDNFAIMRFVRRAYAKRHARLVSETIHGSQGFFEHTEEIQVLRLIIKDFARQVRSNGQLPVLMLFNNRGYSDHLYQVLADTIAQANIPTMSSHTIAPTHDPNHFRPDGHFTPEANKQLARAVLNIIHEHKDHAREGDVEEVGSDSQKQCSWYLC